MRVHLSGLWGQYDFAHPEVREFHVRLSWNDIEGIPDGHIEDGWKTGWDISIRTGMDFVAFLNEFERHITDDYLYKGNGPAMLEKIKFLREHYKTFMIAYLQDRIVEDEKRLNDIGLQILQTQHQIDIEQRSQ